MRENICAILGVTRSPSLLGVVDQSVSLGSRQSRYMTAGELRCYAKERSKRNAQAWLRAYQQQDHQLEDSIA
jgi:hypothetical protein